MQGLFHRASPRGWGFLILVGLASVLVLPHESRAQTMRVVILGSSTAEGTGPVTLSNTWVRRYQSYLASTGVSYEVINLANGGTTTFAALPTGYVSPYRSKWNLPVDPNRNITKALSLNPTHIILNFPSNDAAMGFPATYQLYHYDVIVAEARNRNVPVWVTTSQPRNDTQTIRALLIEMRDSTFSHFGPKAVDFWTGIANADGTIRSEYNVDGIHLNDAAHGILSDRVKTKVPSSTAPSVAAVAKHPTDLTVQAGTTATFTVSGSGAAPLSYQWQKNAVDIPGATSPTLTTPATTLADDGTQFRCAISNPYGRATSSAARLTVMPTSTFLVNGSFETDVTSWTFFTNGSANLSAAPPAFAGTKAAKVQVVTAGSNVQLYQTKFLLEANTQYTLRFAAYNTNGNDLAVSLQQHNTPYTVYGIDNWVADLRPLWSTYSLVFTTRGFTGQTVDTRLRFSLSPFNANGDIYGIDDVSLVKGASQSTTDLEPLAQSRPTDFSLMENFPNPFNPTTVVSYQLPVASEVKLVVYDLLGREVAVLVNERRNAGTHRVSFDALGMPSGAYFYRIVARGTSGETFVRTRSMVLTK